MFIRENSQTVVSDLIDGEMMLLNIVEGNYYSLQGVGVALWDAIKEGTSEEELFESLKTAFPSLEAPHLKLDLENFLTALRNENLLIECPDCEPRKPALQDQYQAPILEKYTDLQDLLLIDPIHEVGDSGWPTASL